MSMVGAAICLPAMGKTVIPEVTMRMAEQIAVRNLLRKGIPHAVPMVLRDIRWTSVALIKRENVVNPYIKKHGRLRRI